MIRNRVIYGIALIGALCTFIATNQAAALVLVLIAAFAPLAAVIAGKLSARKTTITFNVQPSCTIGQNLQMEIVVQRPLALRGRMELNVESNNLLMGTIVRVPISLAPSIARHERFLFPLETNYCGHTVLSLKSMQAVDMLGFSKVNMDHTAASATYTVYPQINDLSVRAERASLTNFSGANYDRQRKGQDRTEVFEMRDFRNGDSFKSVHWKLSARFDELLVREPSRPAEHNIVLLCDAHAHRVAETGEAKTLNAALSVLASLSLALVRQGIEHTVVENDGKQLHTQFVDNRVEFNEMVDALMDTPLSHSKTTDAAPFEMSRTAQTDTKVVLITNMEDETLSAKLSELSNLSVIRISSTGTAGIDESRGYPFIHLPADAVAETKVLEI